jgi:hypothetical protein
VLTCCVKTDNDNIYVTSSLFKSDRCEISGAHDDDYHIMEAVSTSETSANLYGATRRYIPQDSQPHDRCGSHSGTPDRAI